MDGKSEWPQELTREFIHVYRDSPCLWRTTSTDYKNRASRDRAHTDLLRVTRQVFLDADLNFVRRKINILRTMFRKEYNKVIRSAQDGNLHKPKLWCYEELSFLACQESASDLSTSELVESQVGGETEAPEDDFKDSMCEIAILDTIKSDPDEIQVPINETISFTAGSGRNKSQHFISHVSIVEEEAEKLDHIYYGTTEGSTPSMAMDRKRKKLSASLTSKSHVHSATAFPTKKDPYPSSTQYQLHVQTVGPHSQVPTDFMARGNRTPSETSQLPNTFLRRLPQVQGTSSHSGRKSASSVHDGVSMASSGVYGRNQDDHSLPPRTDMYPDVSAAFEERHYQQQSDPLRRASQSSNPTSSIPLISPEQRLTSSNQYRGVDRQTTGGDLVEALTQQRSASDSYYTTATRGGSPGNMPHRRITENSRDIQQTSSIHETNNSTETEDDVFGKMVSMELRKITDFRQKLLVKKIINDALFQGQLYGLNLSSKIVTSDQMMPDSSRHTPPS